MLTNNQYLHIVRASAWYDLVVTLPLATPPTLALLWWVLQTAHESFGLPGAMPVLDTYHVLFANLLGSVVVIWAIVRLRLNLAMLGRYDAAARGLFALWQGWALLNGASAVIALFFAMEIAFGILQLLPVKRTAEAAA